MHYLRYKIEKTPYSLCEAGIKCDSTLGYADTISLGVHALNILCFIPLTKKKLGLIGPLLKWKMLFYIKYMVWIYQELNSFLEIKNKCKLVDGNLHYFGIIAILTI